MNVLVTGATGFIGRALIHSIKCAKTVSRFDSAIKDGVPHLKLDLLTATEGLKEFMRDVDCVVHLAAIAHTQNASYDDFMKVNCSGSINIAKSAIDAGIRRFIFVSSIGVNGDFSSTPFRSDSPVAPVQCSSKSKWAAELELKELFQCTSTELVIVRPVLVYGPNAPGNFAALQKLVLSRIPLPLGSVNNFRSLVALDNLVDLIITCIDHPAAANQTFLVSDDDDVSTAELLRRMAKAFGKKQWLLPVPKWAMALPAKLLGKQAAVERLFGSLQVDITHTKETLGWKPPVTMAQQLSKIADSLPKK